MQRSCRLRTRGMRGLLKFCCFAPPQTLDSQGPHEFKRLEGNKTVGSRNGSQVHAAHPRRILHRSSWLLADIGAPCRLLTTQSMQRSPGGLENVTERTLLMTGGYTCLLASAVLHGLGSVAASDCHLSCCRLLGHYADTPHQHNASHPYDAGSMLLQDKPPASTTQVAVLCICVLEIPGSNQCYWHLPMPSCSDLFQFTLVQVSAGTCH